MPSYVRMNETCKQLVAATRRCIAVKGLAGTTSRDITSAAEANLASITYHFGSKEQLVATALLDALREWLAPTLGVLAGGGDPAARTVVAIQTLTETFEQHRDEAPVYLEALVQAPRIEALQLGLTELWSELRQLLADHMTEMQNDGELAVWVRPDAMASVLIAVANGLVMQAVIDPDGPTLPAMTSQFGALLLAARENP
jgi:AcrR family transcriptional regulator